MSGPFDTEVIQIIENALQEDDTYDHALYERVVVFCCRGIQFGILSKDIYEVIRMREIVTYKVPRTRIGIMGMMNLRGEIIPVVNFNERFRSVNSGLNLRPEFMILSEGIESMEMTNRASLKKTQRLIVATTKGIRFGLLVEEVHGLVHLPKSSFEPEYILGIETLAEYENKPVYLLKLDELF